MQQIRTDVLVIGGGATGTGVLRDLAMRGFHCVLVERRDLAYGTTGRYHGLLHSGGRYVVKDPEAARECYAENQVLHHIMPQCIEDTGGYFLLTPYDDSAYIPKFLAGCKQAGIPVDELPIRMMLKQEPLLDPKIQRCFQLPDASADSFLAAKLNVASARQYGGVAKTYHEVLGLMVVPHSTGGNSTVSGAVCHDLVKDEDVQIEASIVVNASGAWAGKITELAGIDLPMLPGKGTMIALNHRLVNTVINRCKPPADGDILVPAHTVAVMGTTDIKVTEPDHYSIEPWEIRLMLEEGEKLIPGLKRMRVLRAWAGVRPLIREKQSDQNRDVSRAYALLDHAEWDGVEGLVTITSGKWTTYRKMAQVTVDKVCEKLGVKAQCRTHLESLPSPDDHAGRFHHLGARLEKVEHDAAYGELVCECELASRSDIERAIIEMDTVTLDDIRRTTRLGMGPCQGVYCSFRAAGILHSLRHPPVIETNTAIRNFLQERWKGALPILWGQQLRQARFNELVSVNVLNTSHLPATSQSGLALETYAEPEQPASISQVDPAPAVIPPPAGKLAPLDVLVIGGGFAGLITAWQASARGLKTSLITKGWGAPYWASGCIDIFGYQPPEYRQAVNSPRAFLEDFVLSHQIHPYVSCGLVTVEEAITSFMELCEQAGYPYQGSLDANIVLPTALGTLRPTCLVPTTMAVGDASAHSPMLIVGFDHFSDFYPAWIADNLNNQDILVQGVTLNLPSLSKQKYITSMVLAHRFDDPEFRQEVIDAVKPKLGSAERVGFPAVLGLQNPIEVINHLQSSLGIPVFEIPGLPPSIPGIRLQNVLIAAIQRYHGSVNSGMAVTKFSAEGRKIQAVWTEAAARQVPHQANVYILATGGVLGGGIQTSNDGYAHEAIFNLPVSFPELSSGWLNRDFLSAGGHPIFQSGIRITRSFQPATEGGSPVYDNLYAAGNLLANCDPVRECSLEGIALASAFSAARQLATQGGE
jgi:glycerol-3-phosphate dehydrogenase